MILPCESKELLIQQQGKQFIRRKPPIEAPFKPITYQRERASGIKKDARCLY